MLSGCESRFTVEQHNMSNYPSIEHYSSKDIILKEMLDNDKQSDEFRCYVFFVKPISPFGVELKHQALFLRGHLASFEARVQVINPS